MKKPLQVLLLSFLLSVGSAQANVLTSHLVAIDDRAYIDYLDDGQMSFKGSYGNTEWLQAYVDTRLDAVNNADRFSRAGLEFSISQFSGMEIDSAILTIHPYYSRDLMTEPPWGMPTVELWGFAGDGSIGGADLMGGEKLASFSPTFLLDPSALSSGVLSFKPTAWSPVSLDVTDFINEIIKNNEQYAGFRINIFDDLSGQRNLFSEFAFGSRGASDYPEARPDLEINVKASVPEPSSIFLMLAAGLSMAGAVHRRNSVKRQAA